MSDLINRVKETIIYSNILATNPSWSLHNWQIIIEELIEKHGKDTMLSADGKLELKPNYTLSYNKKDS